ncbi:MAG: FAD-dependent oxidoreductase [Pirellulaceae bacterium]
MSDLEQLVGNLSPHLSERCRIRNSHSEAATSSGTQTLAGDFVCYWMVTALRTEENPALDVAKTLAHELGKPLLVYHALSQRYEYASDRLHTFILEGAKDVQAEMLEANLAYVFHLERPGSEESHLVDLAKRAAFVITEDMPTHAPRAFAKALVRQTSTPLIHVDTACVVSPNLVGKAYDRAFAYRNKTKKLYAERVSRGWPKCEAAPQPFDLTELGFESIDLQSANIPDLVAECEIDHSIGPVLDTIGGSAAGYARWNAFMDKGLKAYAKQRNNALLDGVSRMSAYLHFGMVSPMRLAREAADIDHAGAEKYLDELLIWRELAYCFCRFRPDHHQWSALPEWAQKTLIEHSADLREHVYDWETLARGETHDAFWNAAQKSLLIQGELHNNVRMTWGKAILQWKQDPKEALQTIIDLNHRYALDGRDPASYGGILWCLGQFDRPFQPEANMLGTVRPRPTEFHAQRLDTDKYAARTSVTRTPQHPKIAVIGAGLSGCMAARTLRDHALDVTVFEKSRGAGGRMATRRNDFGEFDHGAQYFTARDPRFQRYVESWIDQGVVAEWDSEIVVFDEPNSPRPSESVSRNRRFVGTPRMNSIARQLASDLEIRTEVQVSTIALNESQYALQTADGEDLGSFDRVIVATPAPQAADLVTDFAELAEPIRNVRMNPCWAVMIELGGSAPFSWSGAFVNTGPLRWIACNSTKPGRKGAFEHFVLHASPDWSTEHLEESAEEVAEFLYQAFLDLTGLSESSPPQPSFLQAHRWRYSIPDVAGSQRCYWNEDKTLVACGDWAGGPRVEGAFLSGSAAAGIILGTLEKSHADSTPPPGQLSLF